MSFSPAVLGIAAGLALLAGAVLAQPTDRNIIADWPVEPPRETRPFVPISGQFNPDVPLPQDALLLPTLDAIATYREDMQVGLVAVDVGLGENNPYWRMSQTALTVFLNKLATLNQAPVPDDAIWPNLAKPDPRYNGLMVLLQTKDGRRFLPFRVFMGSMGLGPDNLLAKDPGRRIEYWLFGTARVRRDQIIGATVLPVYTFEQCRLLGQRVIETTPRQCLLANNNLLLETIEPPTLKSAKLTSFNECLRGGDGLIYTFPRRCVAAGGRVFTEPPQIFDADEPFATDAPAKPGAKRLAPSLPSPTRVASPSVVAGLGAGVGAGAGVTATVSPTAPVHMQPLMQLGGGLLQAVPGLSATQPPTWRALQGTPPAP